jgi:putative hemolysin
MISIGEEEGAIEQDEREMLHRVFEFGDTEVSEVMVPRTDMVAVQADVSVTDLMKLVAEKGYSRYPVIKDSVDDVQGVLYLKDVFITMGQASVENLSVGNFMRDAYFVPETKMATELLDDMQKNKIHIAVVIDEYGGTAGLVTLEDIMEEIVGGLQDEFEEIESVRDVEIIDERTFILSGQSDIDEVNELTGLEMSTHDYNTIGGLVFGLFGRLPKVGEQLKTNYAKFLVMDMEGRKVTKVKLTKLS